MVYMKTEVATRLVLTRVVIIKIFSSILYILNQSHFNNAFFVRRMNVVYALIPERWGFRIPSTTVCLNILYVSYSLTRDLRSDSSATNMLYALKYKRREFYDGSVLLLLSITMLQQSRFVFEFHLSMMNAAIILFFFLFG